MTFQESIAAEGVAKVVRFVMQIRRLVKRWIVANHSIRFLSILLCSGINCFQRNLNWRIGNWRLRYSDKGEYSIVAPACAASN